MGFIKDTDGIARSLKSDKDITYRYADADVNTFLGGGTAGSLVTTGGITAGIQTITSFVWNDLDVGNIFVLGDLESLVQEFVGIPFAFKQLDFFAIHLDKATLNVFWSDRSRGCLELQIVEGNLVHRQCKFSWILDVVYLEFPAQFAVQLHQDREVPVGFVQTNSFLHDFIFPAGRENKGPSLRIETCEYDDLMVGIHEDPRR